MTGTGTRRRLGAAGAITVAGLLLAGCVYLRLIQLKHQLADFDHNFTVDTSDGVRITCQHPLLLTGDVRWLGVTPEKIRRIGHAEEWEVRWVKQLPPSVHEAGAYDIVVRFVFADDKLTRVSIPQRYFALMPKKFLLDLLRSLGGARVNKENRSVEAQLAGARPDLPGIEKLLGRPTAESSKPGQTIRRYRYVPAGSRRLARAAVFDLNVTFDDATGKMLRWEGKTPVGNIGFNFEGAGH
ncbi:MAG TPA: hypothetical protein VHE61_13885 [Opitutaceae bacterium]|nr:hypothetical protein [Opitutaceae bacterium]